VKAVILAAGKGTRLAPLTDAQPKPLVEVGGRALLLRALDRLAEVGVADRDVVVVAGYREDVLGARLAAAGRRPVIVTNPKFDVWNSWYSLLSAREALHGEPFVQLEGDVLFDAAVLPRLLAAPGPAVLAVDVRPDVDDEAMKVQASGPERRVHAMGKWLDARLAIGEFVGIARLDAAVADQVFEELAGFERAGLVDEYYDHSYHLLAARGLGPFHAVNVADCTAIEIDDVRDLMNAESLLRARAGA
jgi:choline kinase